MFVTYIHTYIQTNIHCGFLSLLIFQIARLKKSFNLEQMKYTLLECLREHCYVHFSFWTDNFSILNVLYRIHLYAHHNIRFCKNKIAASNHEQSRVANQKQKVTLWIWLYGTALNYQANPPTPKSAQKKTLGIISEQKKSNFC